MTNDATPEIRDTIKVEFLPSLLVMSLKDLVLVSDGDIEGRESLEVGCEVGVMTSCAVCGVSDILVSESTLERSITVEADVREGV